jgi:hypothetical protein
MLFPLRTARLLTWRSSGRLNPHLSSYCSRIVAAFAMAGTAYDLPVIVTPSKCRDVITC